MVEKKKTTTTKTSKSGRSNLKHSGGSTSSFNKKAFDTTAFVFETPLSAIEDVLEGFDARDKDDMAEPFTQQELYWWGRWLTDLPLYKQYGKTTTLVSAQESACLGLYKKTNKRKKR